VNAPGFDPAIVDQASAAQRDAADPLASVFVEANAGSGKTRVLVDRVARLLLGPDPDSEGARPDRILCVTFTKAAAGEMKTRLFRKLGDWSTASDEALAGDLAKLTGETGPVRPERLARARRLFARALETPGGLKIQTLHAFCESLLRRFPLEAGLPPGFRTREDAEAAEARQAALDTVLSKLSAPDGAALMEAAGVLLDTGGADALDTLAQEACARRHALRSARDLAGSLDALLDRIPHAFGVEPGETPDSFAARFWAETERPVLEAARAAYRDFGGKRDQGRGDKLQAALDAIETEPLLALERYLDFRFTKDGELAKSMTDKAVAEAAPVVAALFAGGSPETQRIEAAKDRLADLSDARATAAALRVAHAVIDAYEAGLARDRAVDFSDLIVRAGALLTNADARDWARYKLDQGLDHVLVDEAQDTAPEQWNVVNALSEEFFAGAGAHEDTRTVFCVGDEKQSIYSFQNAAPDIFVAERGRVEAAAEAAGARFASPPLTVSFRSAPEVLEAVDLAFESERLQLNPPEGAAPELKFQPPAGVRPFHRYAGHAAARTGTPGTVEIWPAVPRPMIEAEDDAASAPLDQPRADSADHRLAEAVAGEIAAILERGDAVWEEGGRTWRKRPARPGDILILVRSRSAIFHLVLRALKQRGVPVAGADRLSLPEELVSEDLCALARFALLPEDDLALACVLKSPLFHPAGAPAGLDDEALFALTRRPERRLWDKLRASDDPRFADARAALERARARVDVCAPYAFFAEALNERTPTGETRLARLYARLGEEARDPLESLLDQALAHEREGAPSLLAFVRGLETGGGDLKRETDDGRDEVRLMTVHGAKGLEAPIVFLPDANGKPGGRRAGPALKDDDLGLVYAPRAAQAGRRARALAEARDRADAAEHARLLYVALTRARDRLVVCAARRGHGAGQVEDGSWHHRLDKLWRGETWRPVETALHALAHAVEDWDAEPARRFGVDPEPLGMASRATAEDTPAPDWMTRDAAPEPAVPRSIAPSRLLADEAGGFEPPALSPLAEGGADRFRRGALIHKLLQTLPDVPPERRAASAERFLAAQLDLDPDQRRDIASETLRVIETEAFAALFAPGSRAEVAVAGSAPELPGGARISGQIDRLVVTPHEVLIVDYKTNRPPPASPEETAPAYLAQMAAYQAVLRVLHPGRAVRCALLWTDAPRLMALPDPLLAKALAASRA